MKWKSKKADHNTGTQLSHKMSHSHRSQHLNYSLKISSVFFRIDHHKMKTSQYSSVLVFSSTPAVESGHRLCCPDFSGVAFVPPLRSRTERSLSQHEQPQGLLEQQGQWLGGRRGGFDQGSGVRSGSLHCPWEKDGQSSATSITALLNSVFQCIAVYCT